MLPTFHQQLGGDAGIVQTLGHMRNLVNGAFTHPWIRQRATSLVAHCKRNRQCEERTLQGWVNGSMQFVRDPFGVEALHDPVTYVEANLRRGYKPAGDCDDLSIYLASLLKSIGHQPYFKVISKLGSDFHHVLVYCDGQNLDPTLSSGAYQGSNYREGFFLV